MASLVLSYFQYPRNMWAANRTSSPWVSPERAMPIMGQTVPYYVTVYCIRSFSTKSMPCTMNCYQVQETLDHHRTKLIARGSSVILLITWRSGLDRRMQVRYLARAEIFLFSTSYLVARVKRTGTWNLTTQLMYYRGEEDVKLYLHSSLRLQSVMLHLTRIQFYTFSLDRIKIKFTPHVSIRTSSGNAIEIHCRVFR